MIDSSVTEGVTYIPNQHLKGHSEYVQSELLCSMDCWKNFVLVAVAVSICKNFFVGVFIMCVMLASGSSTQN